MKKPSKKVDYSLFCSFEGSSFCMGVFSAASRFSCSCLQIIIARKNANAKMATTSAHVKSRNAPMGKIAAMQIAESIVKIILNFKNIKNSYKCSLRNGELFIIVTQLFPFVNPLRRICIYILI